MMKGERNLVVDKFVLANTIGFNITQDGTLKSKWDPISKSERGYCSCQQYDTVTPKIASIPCMSSEICPIKDRYPMAFSNR